ncbi:MAG: hypothetical protein OK449_09560 [Thaumarchaeota archaeon]|nr:hypothetical protein [Nitrososphaerota archaeon]
MKVVSVATLDSRAYYSVLNRLKMTNLRFISLTPAQAQSEGREPVITTKKEREFFVGTSISIEELDENPLVMEGQILSKMVTVNDRILLIGIDPGSRIGVVVFYGDSKLGAFTVGSLDGLQSRLLRAVRGIPSAKAVVRVGDGAPRLSKSITQMIRNDLPEVLVEVVDERGTTTSSHGPDGLTRDQGAAARIARRKGVLLTGAPQRNS